MVLLFIVVGLVTAFGLTGHGLSLLGRGALRRTGEGAWFRTLAALLGGAAMAVYTWGLIIVALTALSAEDGGAGSSPLIPCRIPAEEERVQHVIDYRIDYIPLRFVCETNGHGDYATDDVPGYINPSVLTLSLAAVASAGAAALDTERRARAAQKPRE
ncbi:hypothetical protein [Streptomyces cucumeris]|uniref:hypothetical protein n=1 Tax=Streptomyces cucumeris TaxID=2962890 RepID=UPI003D706E35